MYLLHFHISIFYLLFRVDLLMSPIGIWILPEFWFCFSAASSGPGPVSMVMMPLGLVTVEAWLWFLFTPTITSASLLTPGPPSSLYPIYSSTLAKITWSSSASSPEILSYLLVFLCAIVILGPLKRPSVFAL